MAVVTSDIRHTPPLSMLAIYSPVGLKSRPVITEAKEYSKFDVSITIDVTVLGVPFRLAGKLDNIFGIGGIRTNVK